MKRRLMMKRLLFVSTMAFCLLRIGFSQTVVTGSLSTRIDSLLGSLPSGEGANDYVAPTSGELTQFGTVVTEIFQKNYSGANTDAAAFGYHLTQFIDNTTSPNVTYYILEKNGASSHHWGIFYFNPAPQRPKLVIETPHSLFDLNTGKQGRLIFMKTGARALFMNGTHRCNSSSFTTCSGTTTACSDTSQKYRLSDQAHNVSATFQRATEILRTNIANLVVIEPHGFGKDTGDPDAIMSNGTRNTPATDYLVSLRDNLAAIDPTLTFKVAHVDLSWTKLIATENVQGRLINGSGNPCNSSASTSNGRFIHVEQAYSKLRDSETNRKKLSDAIAKTFPADTLTITSPNGGETWSAGSIHSITWSYNGFVSTVKLEYSIDNGANWVTISSSATNNGSYSWTLPLAGTWRARVRISDASNSTTSDVSNSKFTISHVVWPISGTTTPDPIAAAFGPRLLSGVYDFHRGIDLPNSLNTPVHPVKAGVIVRMEDTTQTIGTGLERYGTWMLVKHESENGEPRHTGYLHLNGFGTHHVGDTVSTQDTIAFMGSSGVGINTIHTHLEYYKDLSGTSINKDKIFNPFEIIPYNDANAYIVTTNHQPDSTGVKVEVPDTELDFDEITMYGTLAMKTVGLNSRTGIDPSNNDNPNYNNVYIAPDLFTIDSSTKRITFWTKINQVGTLDSIRIKDVKGYSRTFVDYSGQRYAVTSGNWDDAIWSDTPSGSAGSVSSPTQYDDVVINNGVTVTVNSSTSSCHSISFGGTSAKLALSASSVLNVYGNFALASTTHSAFSSWASGAKLRFAGAETQVLNGWSTSSTATVNTTLMEVVVDKSGDTLRTPHTDMKLVIGTSLEINNGIFLLDSIDDLAGKSFDGSSATTPSIVVGANGTFLMNGGASAIRSGATDTLPIGKMTLYGKASLASTSTLRMNFGNIDIENGGVLTLNPPSSSGAGKFNPGTITIKNGGTLSNATTTNIWYASSTVDLNSGGVYKTTTSTTIFPPVFINHGTVRYARTSSGDQTITDINYHRLEISFSGNKVWTLAAPRSIADSLEINNSATLVLSASSAQSLNLNGTLRLTSGTLDNSNANVGLTLADNGLISRATGVLTNSPMFGTSVNVRYSSTLSSISTGPEIPVSASTLKDVTIICDSQTVTLASSCTINGTLTLSNGIFDNTSQTLSFADGANIRRATGIISAPPAFAGGVNVAYISIVTSVSTGNELPSSPVSLDTLSIQSPMNVTLSSGATVNGALELSNGILFLGDYDLVLSEGAGIAGIPSETTMVVTSGTGSLIKMVSATPVTFSFPVGDTIDGNDYSPATLNITSATVGSEGSVGIRVLNTKHPSSPLNQDYLNRFWILNGNDLSGIQCALTLHYTDNDVHGNESNLVLGEWNGDSWSTYAEADTANNVLSGSVTSFAEYTGISMSTTMSVINGWNLLSVPVESQNMSKTSLFPSAISSAFAFQGAYVSAETLSNGIGYWLKFSGSANVSLSGNPVLNDTIPVDAGWNMIGALSMPFPVGSVIEQGTTITSSFFAYNGSYEIADSLEAGKGYWVKTSTPGSLIVGGSFHSSVSKKSTLSTLNMIETKGLNKLIVKSPDGRKSELFFGVAKNAQDMISLSMFELPPYPPGVDDCSLFDVRYSSGRYVEMTDGTSEKIIPVQIQSCDQLYPVTVSWETNDKAGSSKLLVGKSEVSLTGNGIIRITSPQQVSLKLNAVQEIPKEYGMDQNYPNPFNPTTTIKYRLPVSGHVTLRVYNTLGEAVATLIDEFQEAGYKSVEFSPLNGNAGALSSGVYFYQLQSGGTILTNKLLLMK